MNRKLVAAGALAIVAAVVIYVVTHGRLGRHHAHADTRSVHAGGLDQTDTAVSMEAMLNAPDGATPCETAYGAIEAEQQAAKLRGTKSIFEWVAAKPDFLTSCQGLTDAQQKCMSLRYKRAHDAECQQARPSPETMAKLIRGVPVPEPTAEHP